MIVAELSGKNFNAENIQYKAIVPNVPLKSSKLLFLPQGDILDFFNRLYVINRLINDLASIISDTGILPLSFLTQTVIRLNANVLLSRYMQAWNLSDLAFFDKLTRLIILVFSSWLSLKFIP